MNSEDSSAAGAWCTHTTHDSSDPLDQHLPNAILHYHKPRSNHSLTPSIKHTYPDQHFAHVQSYFLHMFKQLAL
jgi:hypothetical protein